jgi:CBS domain-containing protein
MNAREVMTSPVISATADTPVRDIAQLLLQNHISAIPILDNSGAPISMVSEGDLIGRDETERNAHRDWWLALLAEGDSRSSDFLSSLSRSELVASDIMSRPVVTVGENTDAAEIADLLAEFRIKRVPVVRDGQVVGIVSRDNLLRWLMNEEHRRDVKKEGAVARALEDALAPLRWRFARPHHETEAHAAPIAQRDDTSFAAADFRRLVLDFEDKQALRREDLRHSAEEERRHKAEDVGFLTFPVGRRATSACFLFGDNDRNCPELAAAEPVPRASKSLIITRKTLERRRRKPPTVRTTKKR